MLVNSLLYGSARASRSIVYILVAVWFGVSSDTDSFFLVYALATYLVASFSSVFGIIMIPKASVLTVFDVLIPMTLMFLGVFSLAHFLDSPLVTVLSGYVGLSLAGSLLASRSVNSGALKLPAIATLLGTTVTLTWIGLVEWLNLQDVGLIDIAFGLLVGELTRCLLLNFGVRTVGRGMTIHTYFPYLVIFALFSSVLPVSRIIPYAFHLEGDVTLLSYAFGATMMISSFPALGVLVTNGSKWTGMVDFNVIGRQVRISILFTWAALLGLLFLFWTQSLYTGFFSESIYWPTLLKLIGILLFSVPAFTLVYSLVPGMVMCFSKGQLFLIALAYLLFFTTSYSTTMAVFGLYGGAGTIVGSQYLLGFVFVAYLKGVKNESISNRDWKDGIADGSRTTEQRA